MSSDISEVRFELGHLTLAGLSNNQQGKPVMLAMHGWLDNAASFLPLMPYLEDFHVVAIDMPGHGLSSHRSADAHYHFADWVYDMALLIESQQWRDITLLGHSMGGMVASMLAAVSGDKIKQMVLIEAIGFIVTSADLACDQLKKAIDSRMALKDKQSALHPSFESALKARVAAGDMSDKEASLLLKRGLKQTPQGFIWRSDSRLRTQSAVRLSFEQAKSFIDNIHCPVLYIGGADGYKMVQQNYRVFHSFYHKLRSTEVPGGHHCHMEQPKAMWQQMAEFLA